MTTTVLLAPLRAKKRNALPNTAFALPATRQYPIHDAAHARNAMARLEQNKARLSSAQYAEAKRNILRAFRRFGIQQAESKTRTSIRTANGLSIHVHHMNDGTGADPLSFTVELADGSTGSEDNKPVWNQIAKFGQWLGHPAGPFKLGLQEFEQIVENFQATQNQRIPVDFEHASESDPTEGSIPAQGAPATGWITALDNRGEAGLWGLFEWLEPGRSYVHAGKYRYLSPAIRFGAKDRVTARPIGARLTSVALTNTPFLDGLRPVAASDRERAVTMTSAYTANEYMPKLRACMRLGETATAEQALERLAQLEDLFRSAGGTVCTHQGVDLGEYLPAMRDAMQTPLSDSYDHVFEAIRELLHAAAGMNDDDSDGPVSSRDMRDQAMDAETTAKLRDAEAKINELATSKVELSVKLKAAEENGAALSLRLKDAESKVVELTSSVAARDSELRTLKDAEAKRAEQELDARVDDAFATYKDRKNLSDADKVAMRIVLKSDAATFDKLYPRVAPAQQHLLRSIATGRGDGPPPAVRPVSQASAQEEFRTLSDKYRKEGLSLEDAIIRATNEVRAKTRAQA